MEFFGAIFAIKFGKKQKQRKGWLQLGLLAFRSSMSNATSFAMLIKGLTTKVKVVKLHP